MLHVNIERVLFLDIETVPQTERFEELSEEMQHLWCEKYEALKVRNPLRFEACESAAEGFAFSAGIYAEFGRVICISIGFVTNGTFRIKSFYGDDEKVLLQEFAQILDDKFTSYSICGHNLKEFDVPFICRRMLINGVTIPMVIQVAGKKPWEVPFIDTMELWKFGDIKNYTPLKLLTAIFGIPTPKDDINGSEVAQVYYQDNDLQRIVTYCEKDVLATAQVLYKLCNKPLIDSDTVVSVTQF